MCFQAITANITKNNMPTDNNLWSQIKRLPYYTAAFLFMAGCTGTPDAPEAPSFEKLPSGVYGRMIANGADSLPLAKPGDVLVLNMEYRISSDSVLFSSRDMPGVFRMKLAQPATRNVPTAESVLASLRPGDSVSFYLSAQSFYVHSMKADVPAYIKPGDSLHFTLRLVRTETDSVVDSGRKYLQKSLQAQENDIISEYVEKNMPGIKPLGNGIYIKVFKRGKGSKPQKGEPVAMHYTLTQLNGEMIFTSVKRGEPFQFTMGSEMVIPGLESATAELPRGSHALVLVPSGLAYGAEGYKYIKPFTPLIFEMKLLE